MFDISFSELLVIAIVALVVIGPEKLPKVARTAGAFFGRLQRFVAQVKEEVNREARFAELQKLQDEMKSSLQQGYDDVAQSILPQLPAVEPEVETAPVKKTRKPRQPKEPQTKAAGTARTADKPRRKRASAKPDDMPMADQSLASEPLTPDSKSPPVTKKSRVVKPQPNTDLFGADESANKSRSE